MGFLYRCKNETIWQKNNFESLVDMTSEIQATSEQPFYYVAQDNYLFYRMSYLGQHLYCDSATSCIVLIVIGDIAVKGNATVLISHLSRPGRFRAFFDLVEGNFLQGSGISIYASGANPPEPCKKSDGTYDYTACNNVLQVSEWVSGLSKKGIKVNQLSMSFGQGDPSVYENNLDCFGVVTKPVLKISNDRIKLTGNDRDPTGGLQTLFCIYGSPNKIRKQSDNFAKNEQDTLVSLAKDDDFQRAVNMTDEEILKGYSSTPDFEVPWFAETIRTAAEFVVNYK